MTTYENVLIFWVITVCCSAIDWHEHSMSRVARWQYPPDGDRIRLVVDIWWSSNDGTIRTNVLVAIETSKCSTIFPILNMFKLVEGNMQKSTSSWKGMVSFCCFKSTR